MNLHFSLNSVCHKNYQLYLPKRMSDSQFLHSVWGKTGKNRNSMLNLLNFAELPQIVKDIILKYKEVQNSLSKTSNGQKKKTWMKMINSIVVSLWNIEIGSCENFQIGYLIKLRDFHCSKWNSSSQFYI